MQKLDKKIITKNFSRGAKNYDALAIVQKKSANRLCEIALPLIKKNSQILDLGSGTSFISKNISSKIDLVENNIKIIELDLSKEMLEFWKERPKNISTIQGNFEDLPFKNEKFDLIISSFSLQWCEDFYKNFCNLFSIIKEGGYLVFCIPAKESLQEVRKENILNLLDLPNKDFVKDKAIKAGFSIDHFEQKIYKEEFENILQFASRLKLIGANYSDENLPKTKEFDSFYLKNYDSKNNIEVSWFSSFFSFRKLIS